MARKGKAKRKATEGVAQRHEFTVGGILGHDSGDYAINVSERTALGIGMFQACVRLLADCVADARVAEYRNEDRLDQPSRLVIRPYGQMTRREWLWFSTATMAMYQVVYFRRILPTDSEGVALSLAPIIPSRLSMGPRPGTVLLDGQEVIPKDELRACRRTIWPTVSEEVGSILKLCRELFAAAAAQGAYTADFWENGGAPQVVLTSDQPVPDALAEQISNRWSTKRREGPGKPAVLGHGAKVDKYGVDLSGAGGHDDKLLADIARLVGVPTWPVNAPSAAGSMVYNNTESAGTDLVRYFLRGYLGPLEDAWSEELPGSYILGRRVALDVSHLTMGSLLERYQAYNIATGGQAFMTAEEVRKELHLPVDRAFALPSNGTPPPALESIPLLEAM